MPEAKTTGADDANFSNAETIPANPKYIANFNGDEINGVTYQEGDEIASDVDAGTIRYLVQIGRITEKSAEDSNLTSTGETGRNAMDPRGSTSTADPVLSADETAERDRLVSGNNKDELLALAEGTDATDDNNKAEIATKIVLSRRA